MGNVLREKQEGPGSLTREWGFKPLLTPQPVNPVLIEDFQMMLYSKFKGSGHCDSKEKIFENFIFSTPFLTPVTYLCNELKPFEQYW